MKPKTVFCFAIFIAFILSIYLIFVHIYVKKHHNKLYLSEADIHVLKNEVSMLVSAMNDSGGFFYGRNELPNYCVAIGKMDPNYVAISQKHEGFFSIDINILGGPFHRCGFVVHFYPEQVSTRSHTPNIGSGRWKVKKMHDNIWAYKQ